MRQLFLAAIVIVGLASVSSLTGQAPVGTTGARGVSAHATLLDKDGRQVGEAHLRQTPHGVLLELDLRNVEPGTRAVHVHEVGRCDPPSFESAGDHFTLEDRQHGFLNARGPHTGDVPNVDVPASRQITVEHLLPGLTLESGVGRLLDADGAALVIHADEDDYRSDPAGESGDRIACGPIVARP